MMSMVNFDSCVCAMTDKGLVRSHNEDSNRVAHTANGDLFVVCDGMGGHVGGATASRIGVESICQYASEHECAIPQQFLIGALEYANAQIYAESRSNPELLGMGTTACVALVREDKVWYAHVGDSRIYYFNAKQKALYRLTKDHSVVQALIDRGEITVAEAEHHPEKNKIRKSLGVNSNVEPEPCQMPLIPAEGDMMLICSDGLSGMMDEEDILEVLVGATDVIVAGKVLIDLAKSGGGTDNITVQIIRFSGMGNREAVFDAKNKGVFLSSAHNAEKNPKRLWPWLVIGASAIIIFVAGLLLFPINSKKETTTSNTPPAPVVVETNNYAYINEIPPGANDNYESFKDPDANTIFRFYHRDQGGDLVVNMEDYSYQIGEFVYIEDKNYYRAKPGKVKYFKRNGEPDNK